MGKTKKYKKYSQSPLIIQVLFQVKWEQSSEPVTPVLWRFNMRGHVDVEDLLCVRWRSLRRAVDPWVAVRIGLVRCVFRLQFLDMKWSRWGRDVSLGLDVFEVLQTDHFPSISRAWQQHRDILAKLGAHAEIDERVVEAGRLGKEAGDDAGCAWHVEAPGWPHRHHCIWRPGHDESSADYNGNLGSNMREQLSGLEYRERAL